MLLLSVIETGLIDTGGINSKGTNGNTSLFGHTLEINI